MGKNVKFSLGVELARDKIEEIHREGRECLLCNTHTRNAIAYVPCEQLDEFFRCPKGMTRVYVYALCKSCIDSNAFEQAETVFITRHRLVRAVNEAGLVFGDDGQVVINTMEEYARFRAAYRRNAPPKLGAVQRSKHTKCRVNTDAHRKHRGR